MKKKTVWPILSCLVVAVVVFASSYAEAKEMVKVTLTKLDGTKIVKQMEKPRYGGWINAIPNWMAAGFDPAVSGNIISGHAMLTHDILLGHDWYRGPTGTGEFGLTPYEITEPLFGGSIAESWEQPDPDTLIIKLRKGVRFHNKPPVNGRELVAADVVYALERCVGYAKCSKAFAPKDTPDEDKWRARALDKYTVEFKIRKNSRGYGAWFEVPLELIIYPRESVEAGIADWKNSAGTGPYILTDFVEGSHATLKRNPDFYLNDPFFPDNQLPYPDGINLLYIKDSATKIAALRTGKVDRIFGLGRAEAQTLLKRSNQLKWAKVRDMAASIMPLVNTAKPFDDVRVRRAIWMAIDFDTLVNDIFGGDADKFGYPVQPGKAAYVPLKEMPPSVQELYSHNVEKAKKLLAEAGYPKGFQFTAKYHGLYGTDMIAPFIQANLADIGVDLKLDLVENAVLRSMTYALSFGNALIYGAGNARPWGSMPHAVGGTYNWGDVQDPKPKAMWEDVWLTADVEERYKKIKAVHRYNLEQAFWPGLIVRHLWTFWQPWLKGYSGESVTTLAFGSDSVYRYVWLDQDLKKKMGR